MTERCYLLGQLNNEGAIVAVFKASEPPWSITRHSNTEYVLICECPGDTYAEASQDVGEVYKAYMPRLAEKFPLPG